MGAKNVLMHTHVHIPTNKRSETYFHYLYDRYREEIEARCRLFYPGDNYLQQSLFNEITLQLWQDVDKIARAVKLFSPRKPVTDIEQATLRFEHYCVFRKVRYVALDSYRRHSRETRRIEYRDSLSEEVSRVDTDKEDINELIGMLEPEESDLIRLVLAGYTPREIGDSINRSQSTVYRRINEITKKLKAIKETL